MSAPDTAPALRGQLRDLIAHLRKAIARAATQAESRALRHPDYASSRDLLVECGRVLESQAEALTRALPGDTVTGELGAPLREAASELLGIAGGASEQAARHPVTAMMRECHHFLGNLRTDHLVLAAAAAAAGKEGLATLAEEHGRALASLVERSEALLPGTVRREWSDGGNG